MDMDVSRRTYSNYAIDCSNMKKSFEGFYAKKQEELSLIRKLRGFSSEDKPTTATVTSTEEEESVTLSNNKRMLKALLEIARATSASVYTEDSIKGLAESMSKAAAVSVSKNARASDINKALSFLRSGLSGLRVAEKKDKKGDSGEMLESDLISISGAVNAASDAKNAVTVSNVTAAVAAANVSVSISAAVSPTIDISL